MASKKGKYPKNQVVLAHFAKAFAHPSRLLILKFLEINPTCSFGTLSSVLPISKASTAQHLTVLKDAGLVTCESNPPHMYYQLNRKAWKEAQKLFDHFFSPMSKNEFESMASFLGKNTPDLVKITTEALNTDRKIIEDRLYYLQSLGLVDSDIEFSSMTDEDLKKSTFSIGFNR